MQLARNPSVIELKTVSDTVTISTVGATITSWIHDTMEILFLSKQAILDGTKPIRGGIPLVFPQFGMGDLLVGNGGGKQHGFARDKLWEVVSTKGKDSVVLRLEWDASTMAIYPHKFELYYEVQLKDGELYTHLSVVALDDLPFTVLLHTYLRTDSIASVLIKGLQGLTYKDKLTGQQAQEDRDAISVESEVDRIYLNTPSKLFLSMSKYRLQLEKSESLPDAVLWNPWIAKSKAMSDFGDDEYKSMLCLESGHVGERVHVRGGEKWTCWQRISVQK